MLLNIKDIKKFFSTAKSVKTNTILPVLSYLHFDGNYLTKTNQETFYRSKVASEGAVVPVLLEEQKLASFISPSNIGEAEQIEVTVKGNSVTLALPSGAKPMKFETLDVKAFPVFPDSGETGAVLDSSLLQMIYVARNLVLQTEQSTNFSFVHVAEGGIYASNMNSFYHYETFHNTEGLILSKEAASIIGAFESLNYSKAGNYDFFAKEDNSEAFAFIRQADRSTPLQQFKQVLEGAEKGLWCEFQKADIVAFCELVQSVCPSLQTSNPVSFPDCTLSVKGKKMQLHLEDDVYSTTVRHEYDVLGKYEVEAFKFNPKLFLSYLKSMPFDTLRLSPYSRKGFSAVWTVEDEAFTGILAQIVQV